MLILLLSAVCIIPGWAQQDGLSDEVRGTRYGEGVPEAGTVEVESTLASLATIGDVTELAESIRDLLLPKMALLGAHPKAASTSLLSSARVLSGMAISVLSAGGSQL